MKQMVQRVRTELASVVPEVADQTVTIHSVAILRRSVALVAVGSNVPTTDAVKKCSIATTIHPEIAAALDVPKLLFVKWDPVPERFIANTFAPAKIIGVRFESDSDTGQRIAKVLVDQAGLHSIYDLDAGERPRLASVLTQCDLEIVMG
jgi:transcription antitermination factor NusA-like protein